MQSHSSSTTAGVGTATHGPETIALGRTLAGRHALAAGNGAITAPGADPTTQIADAVIGVAGAAVGRFVASERKIAGRSDLELLLDSRGSAMTVGLPAGSASLARIRALDHAHLVASGGPWLALRRCESGDDYGADTGNGYFGAYQFLPSTWWSIGYSGLPSQASPEVQDEAAQTLEARVGWGAWPVCSALLGLR